MFDVISPFDLNALIRSKSIVYKETANWPSTTARLVRFPMQIKMLCYIPETQIHRFLALLLEHTETLHFQIVSMTRDNHLATNEHSLAICPSPPPQSAFQLDFFGSTNHMLFEYTSADLCPPNTRGLFIIFFFLFNHSAP